MKTLAILVGGGPAPGINAVIAAATIEARNHGLRVLGCYDGFKWLVQGDTQHTVDLEINDTSRIHFDGGSIIRTSRTNPTKTPEGVAKVAEALKRLGVDHLLTIGGDDTAFAASRLAKALEGAIIKRRAHGREQGVAILSEGLAEKLDPKTLGAVERDAYGNVRLAELDLGRLLKERVSASLKARGVDVTIVAKEMGYELRCAPPGAHDIQYCRSLGYWAVRFLLEGGSIAMVTIQAGRLVPVPFGLMMDPKTGKIRVRYADIESEMYQTLTAYMIRLKPEDFDDPAGLAVLAKAGHLEPAEFKRRFGRLVGRSA